MWLSPLQPIQVILWDEEDPGQCGQTWAPVEPFLAVWFMDYTAACQS